MTSDLDRLQEMPAQFEGVTAACTVTCGDSGTCSGGGTCMLTGDQKPML
ncbi:hypothetical protein [Streptomyces lonarensis]|uniref:Uncharacterized protein n=1 Tax=Streptomyces lonarensis TaxID=700599 RepID=A0A7X6HXT9_9ACTN|nr:hypothetical protein [Streptomyces lonarensis]NJQ04484.1 hypothetical protein [Streptomyces lonarensis]